MNEQIKQIRSQIAAHESNQTYREQGISPLFVADARARIIIVGHAPGIKAQTAGRAWDDASGQRLIQWLGIDEPTFRDPSKIALLPMDFYYQGRGKSGDLPPRKDFAPTWHPQLLAAMPHIELLVLAGQYAQNYYLSGRAKRNLTETVRAYREYLPRYFPIAHPSPLNFRWLNKNPWFEQELLPELQSRIQEVLRP